MLIGCTRKIAGIPVIGKNLIIRYNIQIPYETALIRKNHLIIYGRLLFDKNIFFDFLLEFVEFFSGEIMVFF